MSDHQTSFANRYETATRQWLGGHGGAAAAAAAAARGEASDAFGDQLHAEERGELPDAATLASLGCGNPLRLRSCARARPYSTSARAVEST